MVHHTTSGGRAADAGSTHSHVLGGCWQVQVLATSLCKAGLVSTNDNGHSSS